MFVCPHCTTNTDSSASGTDYCASVFVGQVDAVCLCFKTIAWRSHAMHTSTAWIACRIVGSFLASERTHSKLSNICLSFGEQVQPRQQTVIPKLCHLARRTLPFAGLHVLFISCVVISLLDITKYTSTRYILCRPSSNQLRHVLWNGDLFSWTLTGRILIKHHPQAPFHTTFLVLIKYSQRRLQVTNYKDIY